MNTNNSIRWQKFLQSLKKREIVRTDKRGARTANQPEALEGRIAPAAVLDILAGENATFAGDGSSDNTSVWNFDADFTGFYNSGGLTSPDVDGVDVITINANEIRVRKTLIDGGTLTFTGGGGADDLFLNPGLQSFDGLSASDYDTMGDLPALTIGGGGLFIETTADDVTLTGTITKSSGGDATAEFRASGSVIINSGADITSSSNKLNVILNADRDANSNGGVFILSGGTTITTLGGDFTIGGGTSPSTTAVFGPTDKGVYLDGVTVSTGAGNISVRGQGDATSGGGASIGIDLANSTSITTTSGNITLVGTGGAVSDGFTMGVSLFSGTSVNTATGAISITGSSNATGSNAYGVKVQLNSLVQATGNGSVSITGTGASGASGSANEGVALFDNADVLTGGSGSLTITATAGAASHAFSTGSGSNDITIGGGSATGAISVIADSVSFNNAALQTTGTATFRQLTNGVGIDLGSAAGTGATLNLSDAELDAVTAGTLQIGDSNSGAISVSAAITHGNHLSLTTGAGVSGSGDLTLSAGRNLNVVANGAINLSGVVTVPGTATLAAGAANDITINNASNAFNTVGITSGSNVSLRDDGGFDLAASSVSTLLTVQSAGAITQSGALSGAGGLTKNGTGTMTLSQSNSYGGLTTVSAGILVANNASALGSTAGATAVTAGAQLELGSGITVTGETVTIAGGGAAFGGALRASAGTGTWAGTVILGDANARVGAAATATFNISGGIQGSGANQSIFVTGDSGTGVVIFSAASGSNTYTGTTGIIRGTLRVGATDSLPTGTTLDVDTANAVETATFDLNGFNQTVGALQRTNAGGGTGASIVTNGGGAATLTINQTATTTYSGVIQNGTGTVAITKSGAGTLNLTGTNTYSGGTTINAGAIATNVAGVAATSGGLGTGAVSIGATGNLNITGAGVTHQMGTITGTGAVNFTGLGLGTTTTLLNGNLNGFTGTVNIGVGAAAGAGKVQFGSATQIPAAGATVNVLANASLYLSGVLTIPSSITLAGGDTGESLGQLRVENGGIVSGNISLTGDITGAGDATLGSNASTGTFSGVISESGGARTLIKGGAGEVVLSNGANSYTGFTRINAGVLTPTVFANGGANSSIGASSNAAANLVLAGGTLRYNAGTPASTDRLLTLSASSSIESGNGTAANALSFTNTGSIVVNGGAGVTLTLTGTNGGANSFSPLIPDNGANLTGVTKANTGIWTLNNAANTYTGVTSINGGTLAVGTLANGGTASSIGQATNAAANLVFAGGALRYTGAATSTDHLFTFSGGNATIENNGTGALNFTNTGSLFSTTTNVARTLTFQGTNTASSIFSPVIPNNGTGAVAVTKSAAGTWRLAGANTYTGVTTINQGALEVTTLANGGSASSIGAATNAAATLVFNNGTNAAALRFVGTTDVSTDRLFTLQNTTGLATIENNSAANTVTFSNTGGLAYGAANTARSFALGGTNTGDNTFAPLMADNGTGLNGFSKTGTGTWVVTNANTFSGAVAVSAGVLKIANATSLGNTTGATTVASNAALGIQGGISVAENLTISGGGITNTGAIRNFSGSNTLTGLVSLAATARINSDSGSTLTLDPATGSAVNSTAIGLVLGGAGSIAINDPITLTTGALTSGSLAGDTGIRTISASANTWAGTVVGIGTLRLGAANIIPDASAVTLGNTLGVAATLDMNNQSDTVGSIANSAGATTFGGISLGSATLTTGGANTATTYSGIISGTGSLAKVGTGTMTLAGASTYSGGTTISTTVNTGVGIHLTNNTGAGTGTITLNASTATGGAGTGLTLSGGVTVANPLTMNFGGAGDFRSSLLSASGVNTYTGAITLAGTGATSNGGFHSNGGGTLNINGGISGTATNIFMRGNALINVNSVVNIGTAQFSVTDGATAVLTVGGHTWGATQVSFGTLRLGANDAIPTTSSVTLGQTGNTGNLDLNGFNQTVSGLATAGTASSQNIGNSSTTSDGTLTFQTGTSTFGGIIRDVLGSGTMKTNIAQTSGNLTLSATNVFTGTATITGGTLIAGANGALGGIGGKTIINGGTFNINGNRDFGQEPFEVAGTGVGGIGAIVNTGTAAQQALEQVKLIADATFGGAGRFDIRAGTGAAVLDLNGFTLTKIGASAVPVVGGTMTDGNVIVDAGLFGLETSTSAVAGTGTVTVNSGASLGLFQNTGSILRPIILNAGSTLNEQSSLTSTLNAPITLGGAATITVGNAAANLVLTGVIGDGGGGFGYTKTGNGTLTLNGVNTYGGSTTINAGTISISADSGLGAAPVSATAGHLTINGGTLVTTATFTLDANRGVYLGAAAASASGTINTGTGTTLTLNGVIADNPGGADNLVKTGAGTLVLGGANTYTGTTTVNAGVLSISSDANLGTAPGTPTANIILSGGATLESTASFTLDANRSTSIGTGGANISNATGTTLSYGGAITGANTLNKTSNGTLILSGTSSVSVFLARGGTTTIDAGSLTATGFTSIGVQAGEVAIVNVQNGGQYISNGDFNVSDLTGSTGTLNIDGSTSVVSGRTVYIGKGGNSVGTVNQTDGTFQSNGAVGDWRIGGGGVADSASVGTYNLMGGTLNTPANFQVGAYGTGTFTQSGGTSILGGYTVVGRFSTGVGTMNVSAGTMTSTGQPFLIVGEEGAGTLNVSNTGSVTANTLSIAHVATGSGTTNLNGGTLAVNNVQKGTGASAVVNFDGGTLQARQNNATFLTGLTSTNVKVGGGTIDTNSFDVTIAQNILEDGVSTGGTFTKVGAGIATLTGAGNTFAIGAITGGTLHLTGSHTPVTGVINANSGGTLTGTGTVAGTVNVNSGGSISAGTDGAVGTFTIANIVFNGGAYKADLIGTANDKLAITGTANLNGGTAGIFTLNNAASGIAASTVFNFIELPGLTAITGVPLTNAAQGSTTTVDGQNATYSYLGGAGGNDFTLTVDGPAIIAGTAGSDTFEVRRVLVLGDDVVQTLLGGIIIDSRPAATVGTVTINGTDGDDTVFINFGSTGGVHNFNTVFNGGSQTVGDSLSIGGASVTTVTHAFVNNNDGSITVVDGAGTRTITYTGLEPVVDNLDAVNRVFDFSGATETISLTDAGGGTMTIDSNVGGESVTFANPTTSLTINAGAGDDTINLTSLSATYAGSLTVSGDGDADSITISTGFPTLSSASFTAEAINAATLTTSGNQTYNGAVVLSAATTLTSTAGGISATGSIDGAQTLSVSATAGNIDLSASAVGGVTALTSLTTSSATISALPAVTAGALSITTTAGGVSGANNLLVSGATSVTAAGAITLNGAGNDLQGTVTLSATAAGAIAVTDSTGGLNVVSAATTDGAISLTATSGNLTVTSANAGTAGAISLTTLTSGDVLVDNATTSGTMTINSVGAIEESGADAGADLTATSLSLTAATGIGAAGIVETAVSIITGSTVTGGIDLANAGALSITSLAASTSGNITLTNTGSIALAGNVSAASGNVSLTTTANITRAAGTVSGTTVTFSATAGSIGASGAEVNTSAGSLVITSSGDQFVTEANGANVTSNATAGNITLTTTTGDWTLNSTGVDASGTVTISASAGDILRSGVAADITGTTLTLAAGGASGDLGASGNELLTTGAAIVFAGAGTGDVFITETDGATVTGTNGSGTTTLTTTTGDWTIDSTGVDASGVVNITASAGDILRSGVAADITGTTLTLVAGGADGDLGATGNALLTGGASVVFTGSGTGDVFITEADGANVTGSTGSGSISLITTTGDWTVNSTGVDTTGNVTITASAGDILRSAAAADITGDIVSLSAGGADGDLGAAGNALLTSATSIAFTAAGAGDVFITETNGATVTGTLGSGSATLTSTTGDWTVNSTGIDATGGNVTLIASLGDILRSGVAADITGNVITLTAGGADGDIGAPGNAVLTAATSIVFTGTGTGDVLVTESNGANVSGTTGAGNITLVSTSGDWTIVGGGISTTGDVSITATTGGITRTAGTVSGNALTMTAGLGIGASGAAIQTNVATIATTSTTDQFITEANGLAANLLDAGTANISLTLTTGALTDNNAGANNFSATNLTLVAPAGIDLDTAATTLVATTSNANIVIRELDSLALNIITAGTADVNLEAGGAITDNNGALNNILSNTLTISAATGIDSDTNITTLTSADVSGTGDIDINDLAGGLNVTTATAAAGNITINANGGNLNVTVANASDNLNLSTTTSGDVNVNDVTAGLTATLVAVGRVDELAPNDGTADITALNVDITAGTGIGTNSGGALETALTGTLDALTNTGGIFIDNSGIFTINDVSVATSGNIVITGDADITVDGTVSTTDDITIHAVEFDDGAGPYTNNLTVNGTVGSAGTNNVTLRAGDDLTIAATGVVNGTTSIEVCAGYNDSLDARGLLTLDGMINIAPGGGLILCASGDIVFGPPATPGAPVINAPGSNVTLTTTNGNIYDNNDNDKPVNAISGPAFGGFVVDVVANILTLNAPNGYVGEDGDTIESTVNSVTAAAGNGGVFLWNTAALTVAAVTTAGALATAVDITSQGSMTINGPVTDSGEEDINFFATGASSDLTLVGSVSGSGNMNFDAGNRVILGGGSSIVNGSVLPGVVTVALNAGWPNQPNAFISNPNADLTLSAPLNAGNANVRLTAPRHVTLDGGNADITTTGSFSVHADRDASAVGTGGTFQQVRINLLLPPALDSTVTASSVEIIAADVELGGTIDAGTGDIDVFASRPDSPIRIHDTLSGDLNISISDLLALRTVGGTITLGEATATATVSIGGLGTVGVGLVDANYTINGGAIDFNRGIVLHDDRILTLNATLSGLISTTGGGVTDVVIGGTNGMLVIDSRGSVTLNTRVTNLGVSQVDDALVLNNTNTDLTIAGDVTTESADITVGTGTLTVGTGFTLASGVGAVGTMTITADGIVLNGELDGGGVLTLRGNTVATTFGFGNGATGMFNMEILEVERITDGFEKIVIGRTGQTGDIEFIATLGDEVTFVDPVQVVGGTADVTIRDGKLVGGDADASFDIVSGTLLFTGTTPGITTEDQHINITSATTLASDTVLDSNAGSIGAGGDITLIGTINGAFALGINSADAAVNLLGNPTPVSSGTSIGGSTALDSITVTGGLITLRPNITTTGNQDYDGSAIRITDGTRVSTTGNLTFNGPVTVEKPANNVAGGNITFNGDVNSGVLGKGALGLKADNVTFAGSVGDITQLAYVSVTATGTLTVGASGDTYQSKSFTIKASEVDFLADVSVPNGTLSIEVMDIFTAIRIGGTELQDVGSAPTLNFSASDIAALQDGIASIIFGRAAGDQPIVIAETDPLGVTFLDAVTFRQTGPNPGKVQILGDLIGDTPNGSITTLGKTIITGTVTTLGGGNIDISSGLVGADIVLDTSAGGGDIFLRGSWAATVAGSEIMVNAGAGDISITGGIGLASAKPPVLGLVTLDSSGTTTFGTSLAADSLIVTGGGITKLGGAILTTGAGGQVYDDAVQLAKTTTITSKPSTGSGIVQFNSTVDSIAGKFNSISVTNRVAVPGATVVEFNGAIGAGQRLGTFRIYTSGDALVAGDTFAKAVSIRAAEFTVNDVHTSIVDTAVNAQTYYGTGNYLGAITTERLTITSTADISNAAPWQVSGLATISGGRTGNVSITNVPALPLNTFGEMTVYGNDVDIEAQGAINFRGIRALGATSIFTTGNLTQTGGISAESLTAQTAGSITFDSTRNRVAALFDMTAGGSLSMVSANATTVLIGGAMTAGAGDVLLAATAGSFIYTGSASISASGSWTMYSTLLKYPSYDLQLFFGPDAVEAGVYPDAPSVGGNVIIYRFIGA
jgi:fibronectin-binding autotransporter adhesin